MPEQPKEQIVFDKSAFKPLECEAGSLVLLHGNLIHASEANNSKKDRVMNTFAFTDKGSWL